AARRSPATWWRTPRWSRRILGHSVIESYAALTRTRSKRGRGIGWPRLGTVGGLGGWALAAAVALEGQSLATTPDPEDGRPWLIAAALVGYVGVRLLERDTADEASDGASTRIEPRGDTGKRVDLLTRGRLVDAAIRSRRCVGGLAFVALGGGYALLA